MRKIFAVLLLYSLLSIPIAAAQGPEAIVLNENKTGDISQALPTRQYVFSAVGQAVTVRAFSLSPGFAPTLRLLDANSTYIDSDFNATFANEIVLVVQPTTNLIIEVGSANGALGQFLLSVQLGGTPPPALIPLALRQPVRGTVQLEAPQLRYTFDASPTCSLRVTVTSDLSTSGPQVLLADRMNGEILGIANVRLIGGAFTVPSGSSQLIVKVRHSGGPSPEPYMVLLEELCASDAAPPPATGSTQVELPSSGACMLATLRDYAVNVRAEPNADAAILTILDPSQTLSVIGKAANSEWYQVNTPQGVGWVATNVSRRGGDCAAVPVTAQGEVAPSEPTQQSTPTTTPTATQTLENLGATVTATPTATYTATTPAPLPDLDLAGAFFAGLGQNPGLYAEEGFNINVNVTNIGQASSPATTLIISIDEVVVGTLSIPALSPGAPATVTYSIGPNGITAGVHSFNFVVDPSNTITESDETNNSYMVQYLINDSP